MRQKSIKHEVKVVRISERHDGQRVDNFLIYELKGVPRTRIYRLIRRGEVRVNKKRIKPSFKLSCGDEVRIPPTWKNEVLIKRNITPGIAKLLDDAVLLETNLLLVINKPAGLSVHGGSGVRTGIIEALRQIRAEWGNAELAHRLDKDTSGCLVIAKMPKALKMIQNEFREKRVEKTYHALVHAKWPEQLKKIDMPLKKNQLHSGERLVRIDKEGKTAETHFKVLQHFGRASLIEAVPTTGRTHQIRVHCQHAGYPIIGDSKYGPKMVPKELRSVRSLCLHAAKIRFSDPASDQMLKVEAPWDKHFYNIYDNCVKIQ